MTQKSRSLLDNKKLS